MNNIDLQFARIAKSINNSSDERTVGANHSNPENIDEPYKGYMEQMKKNRIRLNGQNYTYQPVSFFDNKFSIPLLYDNFKPMLKDENEIVLFNREGCYFHLCISETPPPYKSRLFYKAGIIQHYKNESTPLSWVKCDHAGSVKYGIYNITATDNEVYYIANFTADSDTFSFNGSLICPEYMHDPWVHIYEASIYLITVAEDGAN